MNHPSALFWTFCQKSGIRKFGSPNGSRTSTRGLFSLAAGIALAVVFLGSTSAHAQATYNAASCNASDVQAALNSISSGTATLTIPSGTCAWTGPVNYTVPSSVTDLTIQGQTSVNCTGTAGTSSYVCTSMDSTVIQDSYNSSNSPLNISMSGGDPNSCYFRLTGITFAGGAGGAPHNDGIIHLNGPCNNLRIDHNNFDLTTYSPIISGFPMRLYGQFQGVIDHNIQHVLSSQITSMVDVWGGSNDATGWGDGSWAAPTNFGSSAFLFVENNYMNGGYLEDCYNGGAFVARYNSILNGGPISAVIHSHGTYTPGGRGRSCRAYEAYHNYIQGPSPNDDAVFGSTGGPSLVWGNTLAGGYNWFAALSTSRNDGSHTETNTPSGWGYCGTSVNGNGVGSAWDGNSPSVSGWPCLDGLGRGQGQALNGLYFPNALNSVSGTISWPHEYLEPIYYFNNSILNGAAEIRLGGTDAQFNRDVYGDCGLSTSGCSGSFNGSQGTGSGPASARPSTCTAGPGGTYGQSPTGSYGVAYWETDQQRLDVCTSANTWTGVYKPYTYPHPLVSGNQTSSAPPPPTNLTSLVN